MTKKIYLFIFAISLVALTKAQNAIPNGGFENWTSSTYNTPTGYNDANAQTFFRCGTAFNCLKVADPVHGSFAIQLTTNVGGTDTCPGYIINSNNTNGNNPCQWRGGMAFAQTPTGIRGSYKSNIMAGDSAGILFAFRNGSTCLGMYMYKFYGTHNSYTPFAFTFNPPLAGTPDTLVFAAVSSDVFDNVQKNGSMFQLDSLSFTGIATQPANFDGDFENWTSTTLKKPNGWYLQSDDQGNGVLQTTDVKAGSYAAEIKTFLGDRGNGSSNYPVAQAAGISTGYSPRHCGSCSQMGGNPFTNQIDTLCFYYKYAPMGNDTAQVSLNFKHAGNNVWMGGTELHTPASTYSYVEVAFNVPSVIDTVIVGFNSSSWRDSALSYIGSDLKVDEVHFKSQPLNIGIRAFDPSVGVKIFPNPSSDGNFVVSNVEFFDLVRVTNVYGQEVNAEIKKQNGTAKIQINNPGAYFVNINSRGKITTLKVIVAKE